MTQPNAEPPRMAAGQPPGGYGGGPPPGGYGGGGPPGGYGGGGPPGGYGGGPPPGGFGGGPPPGGFGGPPPGGFGGPPGGYGGQQPYGAPGGFGAPPPKKPNIGLFIGLGCLGLLVIGGIVAGALVAVANDAADDVKRELATGQTDDGDGTTSGDAIGATGSDGALSAELVDLRDFKGTSSKGRYFVGEIKNTGSQPIGFPSAKLTFYDAAKTAIDSGTCASLVRELPPGEKVPCTFAIFKTTSWANYKAEIKPMKSYFRGKLADLDITGTTSKQKSGYKPHEVNGKITNKSSFKAKSVWAIVSLYGADGKIVGADQTLVAGNDLEAGGSALFSAKVYNVAAQPDTFRVLAVGYAE